MATSGVVSLVAVWGLANAVVVTQVQRPTPREATALTHQLMSPFCHGLLLADCTSPNAAMLRQEIANRIDAGESGGDIKADLVLRYGADIKGSPDASGFGLFAWWAPAFAGLIGLAVTARTVRRAAQRSRNRPPPAVEAGQVHSAAVHARLQDELDALN